MHSANERVTKEGGAGGGTRSSTAPTNSFCLVDPRSPILCAHGECNLYAVRGCVSAFVVVAAWPIDQAFDKTQTHPPKLSHPCDRVRVVRIRLMSDVNTEHGSEASTKVVALHLPPKHPCERHTYGLGGTCTITCGRDRFACAEHKACVSFRFGVKRMLRTGGRETCCHLYYKCEHTRSAIVCV